MKMFAKLIMDSSKEKMPQLLEVVILLMDLQAQAHPLMHLRILHTGHGILLLNQMFSLMSHYSTHQNIIVTAVGHPWKDRPLLEPVGLTRWLLTQDQRSKVIIDFNQVTPVNAFNRPAIHGFPRLQMVWLKEYLSGRTIQYLLFQVREQQLEHNSLF
jgi:hypothetical protein